MAQGRFYLARAAKINLNQGQLIEAILNSPIIKIREFEWVITDIQADLEAEEPYIYGKLSKYAEKGSVEVIDENSRSQIFEETENLVEASSPFIYLPNYSGIAYLHVWNRIPENMFRRRFKRVIESYFDSLLVQLDLEPVTDYREFSIRVSKLSVITDIKAKVVPPNPLFGRLWGELKEYLDEREASEIKIEESGKQKGLKSKISDLMIKLLSDPNHEPEYKLVLTDAAILMAADGYGKGKIEGYEGGEKVEVKTSDSKKSFSIDKEATIKELVEKTATSFESISRERDMKH